LILVMDQSNHGTRWQDFPGLAVRPISARRRTRTLRILPSIYSSGGEIQLPADSKYRLELKTNNTHVLAETAGDNYPLIVYRRYGLGYVMTIALPPHALTGTDGTVGSNGLLMQLLSNALQAFSSDVYTSPLTREVPVQISLKNETAQEKQVTVTEKLPYGTTAQEFHPEPHQIGNETRPTVWKLTLPAFSEIKTGYWLTLPDQIDSYDIVSEIQDQPQLTLTLEVSQTIAVHLNQLITDLEQLPLTGSHRLEKTLRHLNHIRNRVGDSPQEHQRNVQDLLAAAEELNRMDTQSTEPYQIQIAQLLRHFAAKQFK